MDGQYEEGTEIILIAEPAVGYGLAEWSGDISGDVPEIKVVMDSDKQVVANFERVPTLVQFDIGIQYFAPVGQNIMMDFDTDGDLDLIILQFDSPRPQDPKPILALRNDGNGNFTNQTSEVFAGLPVENFSIGGYAVADFNGDGLDDLFIGEQGQDQPGYEGAPPNGGQNIILIQNDKGQLLDETEQRLPKIKGWTHDLTAGDIDSDGDMDIYTANITGTNIGPQIYVNDGAGYFTVEPSRLPGLVANRERFYTASHFVDIDQDSDLDLVLGFQEGHYPDLYYLYDAVLLNDGSGTFSIVPDEILPPRTAGPESANLVYVSADFNQDGFMDLLASPHQAYEVGYLQLMINNGDGTFRDESDLIDQDWSEFEPRTCYGEEHVHPGAFGVVYIVDSNNDEWPDILVADTTSAFYLLYQNNQGNGFTLAENLSDLTMDGLCPWSLIPGDVNGDNIMDVVLIYPSVKQQVYLRTLDADSSSEKLSVIRSAKPLITAEQQVCVESPEGSQVQTADLVFRDDFEDALSSGWEWVREVPNRWDLTSNPDFLRLTMDLEAYPRNILLRPAPEGNFEIAARVLFTPTENFEFAGLEIYQDDKNLLRVGRGFCQIPIAPSVCIGNGIYFDVSVMGYNWCPNIMLETQQESEAYLRLRKEGNLYTAYYSEDGTNWTLVGQQTTELKSPRIGLVTTGSSYIGKFADFDYFTIYELP